MNISTLKEQPRTVSQHTTRVKLDRVELTQYTAVNHCDFGVMSPNEWEAETRGGVEPYE